MWKYIGISCGSGLIVLLMVGCLYFRSKKKPNQTGNVQIELHDLNVTHQHENEITDHNQETQNRTKRKDSNNETLNRVREFIMDNTYKHDKNTQK